MHVILVHGVFDDGANLRDLEQALTAAGHTCWLPVLRPADGRLGILDLAEKLAAYIETHLPREAEIAFVGFSMGCLVARVYLQLLGGHARTRAFFSISGPHKGTLIAYLYFGRGARDMRPGSVLLRILDATQAALEGIALFAYWTPFDVSVLPGWSGDWRLASESLRTRVLLHPLMPKDQGVCAHIVGKLDLLARERPSLSVSGPDRPLAAGPGRASRSSPRGAVPN